jgi:hypothetical protein
LALSQNLASGSISSTASRWSSASRWRPCEEDEDGDGFSSLRSGKLGGLGWFGLAR